MTNLNKKSVHFFVTVSLVFTISGPVRSDRSDIYLKVDFHSAFVGVNYLIKRRHSNKGQSS